MPSSYGESRAGDPVEVVPDPSGGRTAVIVELFTSEGCSSCPPADQILARLDQTQPIPGVEVIALSEHVDYWNQLGWTDPYSSHGFSERQAEYVSHFALDSSYTPQMVVNGSSEFVGSRWETAVQEITKAASKGGSRVQIEKVDTGSAQGTVQLKVTVEAAGSQGGSGGQQVWLAITESKLESSVLRGENSGRRLQHQAVVRLLKSIGTGDGSGRATLTPVAHLSKDWNPANLRAVAFVQNGSTLKIDGAAAIPLK